MPDPSGREAGGIDANLEELIKGVYLLVLGLGFTYIVRDLVAAHGTPVTTAAQLVYFGALYYFLSYDWIAYSALMNAFPYSVSQDAALAFQGRFYADLVHLTIKAALIFLVLRPLEFSVLATVAVLFAGWHATIVGWHLFARREYEEYTVKWGSHAAMGGVYLGLVPLFFVAYRRLSAPHDRLAAVLVLAAVVVWYATRRKRTLIETVA